jgi:hypothetical protein
MRLLRESLPKNNGLSGVHQYTRIKNTVLDNQRMCDGDTLYQTAGKRQ